MPTKSTMGMKITIKTIQQVKKDAQDALIFLFKKAYIGLKMPVKTAARIIMEMKGHRSRPSKKMDIRKSAKKNHRILSF